MCEIGWSAVLSPNCYWRPSHCGTKREIPEGGQSATAFYQFRYAVILFLRENRQQMIHTRSIAPMLSVRNGANAVEFYKAAFGASESFRVDDPGGAVVARLSVGDAEFWLADESPERETRQTVCCEIFKANGRSGIRGGPRVRAYSDRAGARRSPLKLRRLRRR